MSRYRYDTGSIIDQDTGDILTERQVVNRLNRQDALIKAKRKQVEAMVNVLNEEIEYAEDVNLKLALKRIAHRKLEL